MHNPQIGQSYILLGLLRKECQRINKKIQAIPYLQAQIQATIKEIIGRERKQQQMREARQDSIARLRVDLGEIGKRKKQRRSQAEVSLAQLQKNISKIKTLKSQILQQKLILSQNSAEQQNILNSISTLEADIFSSRTKVQQLSAAIKQNQVQREIGIQCVGKAMEIVRECKRKEVNAMTAVTKLHTLGGTLKSNIQNLKSSYAQIQSSLSYTVTQNLESLQSRSDKQHKLSQLAQNLSSISTSPCPSSKQLQATHMKIQGIEKQLKNAVNQLEKVSAEMEVIRAEVALGEREGRLCQHRWECVGVLLRRLEMCGDRVRARQGGNRVIFTARGGDWKTNSQIEGQERASSRFESRMNMSNIVEVNARECSKERATRLSDVSWMR